MKGGGQQQNPPDQALDLYLMVGFIVVAVLLLWYYYSTQIVSFIFSVRLTIAYGLLSVLEFLDASSALVDSDVLATIYLKSAIAYMENTPPGTVTYQDPAAPVIGSISPNNGNDSGNTRVTIAGNNFYSYTDVELGGVDCVYVSHTLTSFVCDTGAYGGSGAVNLLSLIHI